MWLDLGVLPSGFGVWDGCPSLLGGLTSHRSSKVGRLRLFLGMCKVILWAEYMFYCASWLNEYIN